MWTTVALGMLLLSVHAMARQEKTQAVDSILAGDPRLSQMVRIHCEGMAVDELLASISRQTGVALKADRTVADDKVIAFCPARPLKATLSDLAALFNDAWTIEPGIRGQRIYRLTRPLPAQNYENRLAASVAPRIAAGMAAYVRALDEPASRMALRDRDDLLHVYAGTPSGRVAGSIYRWLRPAQLTQFLTHRHLLIPYDTLPDEIKQGLRAEYMQHIAEYKRRRQAEPNGYPYPLCRIEDLEGSLLRVDLSLLHGGYLPRIAFGKGASLFFGRVDARDTYLVGPRGDPYRGNPIAASADLPTAAVLLKAAQQENWTDRLKRLADELHVPILADYYRNRPVILERAQLAPQSDIAYGLDTFCRPAGYLWWTRGRTLLFRKRDWYDQRRYEAADRWILEMIRRVEAHDDHPTYADVFRLRDLTLPQLMGLCGEHADINQYDEFDYSGAPELLAITQSVVLNADTRIPEGGVVHPDEEMPVAWPIDTLTAQQKRLLDGFQSELPYDLAGPASKVFRAEISYGGLPKNVERFGYRYHRINLEAKYDHDETHYLAQLSLPATLIDDRRDQTRIEVVR